MKKTLKDIWSDYHYQHFSGARLEDQLHNASSEGRLALAVLDILFIKMLIADKNATIYIIKHNSD